MPRSTRPRRLLSAALTAGLVAVGALALSPSAYAADTAPAQDTPSTTVSLSADCVEGRAIVTAKIQVDVAVSGDHAEVSTSIDGDNGHGWATTSGYYETWSAVTRKINTVTVVINNDAPIVKTIDTTTVCAQPRGVTTKAWNLTAATGADGKTTLSFGYALLDGYNDGYVLPAIYSGSDAGAGTPVFDDRIHVTTPGNQSYAHTLDLAPGTYTLQVKGNVVCGGDCYGEQPIADDYHFTVTSASTPTPTTEPTPTPAPVTTPTASLSRTAITADSQLTVTGSGFAAGESIELWLHSTPVKLATLTAAADGTFSQAVTIPAGTDAGSHTVEVRGATSGSISLALSVVPGLAVTGGDDAALLPLGGVAALFMTAGAVLFAIARTRSRHQGSGAV